MQQEDQSMGVKKVLIKTPEEVFKGVCNLCFMKEKEHSTIDCPFCIILYHATNLESLQSIVENGFNPRTGRLGKALYCSDDQEMCVRFVLKNVSKFPNPVLVKIKAFITNMKIVESSEEVKSISRQEFEVEGIDCIRCPYFKVNEKILYEYAIYNTARENSKLYDSKVYNRNYAVVGWSRIKLPENTKCQSIETKEQKNANNLILENHENKQIIDSKIDEEKKIKLELENKICEKKNIDVKYEDCTGEEGSLKCQNNKELEKMVPEEENKKKEKKVTKKNIAIESQEEKRNLIKNKPICKIQNNTKIQIQKKLTKIS